MHTSRILAFILLTAFALQAFSRLAIVANYHLNTAAFIEQCINKSRPRLKCKGQCQMMKQMAAEEKRQQAPSENKSVEISPIMFVETMAQAEILPAIEINPRKFLLTPAPRLLQQPADIFRPPA